MKHCTLSGSSLLGLKKKPASARDLGVALNESGCGHAKAVDLDDLEAFCCLTNDWNRPSAVSILAAFPQ